MILAGLILFTVSQSPQIEQSAYAPILTVIAKGESNGNYNAYFGQPQNADVRLTEMTLKNVIAWQRAYVDSGIKSSAAGRYQIIRPTLESLMKELKLSGDEKYDEAMQNRLAIALLERRGAYEYVYEDLSVERYAANLSQEWAALPKVVGENPTESYYAGDGLNKSRVSVDEVIRALKILKANGTLE